MPQTMKQSQSLSQSGSWIGWLQALDTGVFGVGRDERICLWNPAMSKLAEMDLSADSPTLSKALRALLPNAGERDRIREAVCQRLDAAPQTPASKASATIQTRSGALRHVEFEIASPPAESEARALVLAHDLTPGKKAMENLEILLSSSTDGIFILDRLGQISLFNEACERITGFRRDDVLYQPGLCQKIFFCPITETNPALEGLCPGEAVFASDEEIKPIEQRIHTADGGRRWVECSYSRIPGPDGSTRQFMGILRDISKRKDLEEKLQLHKRLASLGELVSGLAHEIRNPLGIISSAADIVCNEDRPAQQRRDAGRFIKEEASRLNRTMQSLLSLTRPVHAGGPAMDVNELLDRTTAFYAPQHDGFRIQTEYAAKLESIPLSQDGMQTVFLNLILNADQAMTQGGTLFISTEGLDGSIRIRFRDQGPGISPDMLERIFLPFETTKKSGAGLGLSMAAHVVQAHNGAINAQNAAEGGAVFTVELPLDKNRDSAEQSSPD